MEFTYEQVDQSSHNLHNLVQDLFRADYNTYLSRVKSLCYFLSNDPVVSSIVNPLLCMDLDVSEIEQSHGNGWGTLLLPVDNDKRISYALKVIYKFCDFDGPPTDYSYTFFYKKGTNASLRLMNEQLFSPAFRDLSDKIRDIAKPPKPVDRLLGGTQINIQAVHAHAPTAIGGVVTQTINNNTGISEQLVIYLLQNQMKLEDVLKIVSKIMELSQELEKEKPSTSTISSIFKTMKDAGLQVAVQLIATFLSRPEVTTAALSLL